ncbi:hypothetical protein EKO27_g7296 [Xylaria grammica]|uniref:Uncharacterized protein n=1 Tax=Xylaria grammica TaxID=363999 RepID=A0A439D038_9PEZI|nr:hypothetical protein EKO27_g7296 [Xylaria grammica]
MATRTHLNYELFPELPRDFIAAAEEFNSVWKRTGMGNISNVLQKRQRVTVKNINPIVISDSKDDEITDTIAVPDEEDAKPGGKDVDLRCVAC